MPPSAHRYRFSFLDRKREVTALDIEVASDEKAAELATVLLADLTRCSGIEVWDGSRQVCRHRVSAYAKNGEEASRPADGSEARWFAADEAEVDALLARLQSSAVSKSSRLGNALGRMPSGVAEAQSPAVAIHGEIAARFGVLPNFFCSASAAPGLIDELWKFAMSAYLDNPLPSLFKERLFVFLSRLCPVRYCLVRHFGFLIGLGRPAGDPAVPAQTPAEVISLLERPIPDAASLDKCISGLLARALPAAIPDPGTPIEAELFDALALLFLTPLAMPHLRDTVRHVVGETNFEYLIAFLAFIRTAHYWTETHPDIDYEPDVLHLTERNETLARLLVASPR